MLPEEYGTPPTVDREVAKQTRVGAVAARPAVASIDIAMHTKNPGNGAVFDAEGDSFG